MNYSRHTIRQTALASAMIAALGTSAISGQVSADILTLSYSGWFSMVNPDGTVILYNGDADVAPMYGQRTAVGGTMTLDTDTGSGTATMVPFAFFGAGPVEITSFAIQAVGDGSGGAGPLVLGNMEFDWNGNIGIPVSIVWDASGLYAAIADGLSMGDTVTAGCANCVEAATENFVFGVKATYTLPMGPVPMATTTFNTTDVGTVSLGTNPSGTLPLTDDGIGGSPVKAGPFPGFNVNFDFDSLTVTDGPQDSVSITIPGGDTQECTAPEGRDVIMDVQIAISGEDAVDTVSWSLDGVPVASGESVVVPVPLGGHVAEVRVTTVSGRVFPSTATITVADTTAPVIAAVFLDSKTGIEITSISSKDEAVVAIEVTDTCDTSPNSSATAGLAVVDGNTVAARISKKNGTRLAIEANADNMEVMVMAEDASGNKSSTKTSLKVTQK